MSLKRIHPVQDFTDSNQYLTERPYDESLSEFEFVRKQVKRDYKDCEEIDNEQNCQIHGFGDQIENDMDFNNLYFQEFENLKACSFKTISKIDRDKANFHNKIQLADFDANFSSASRKRRQSLLHLSEERIKNSDSKHRSRKSKNFPKQLLSYGSFNEFSKLEKRNSIQHGIMEKMKKRESSYSVIPSINTQFVNQLFDLKISDKNEINDEYLKKMTERALIKNVKFTANLFCRHYSQQKFFGGVKIYKLLDVDGFSITGFYVERQKLRINLKKLITNKQFEKKFILKQQPHHNVDKSKHSFTRDHGIEFEGEIYNCQDQSLQQIKFHLSEVRDYKRSQTLISDEMQNINFENYSSNNEGIEPLFGNFRNQKENNY